MTRISRELSISGSAREDAAPLKLGLLLGWQDLRQAYRRTKVGPLWITAGMALQIVAMGVIFGTIFSLKTSNYVPFLALGIIFWGCISSTLGEGAWAFIHSSHLIRQTKTDARMHVIRVVWKNVLILGHNLILLPAILLIFDVPTSFGSWLALPGLVLLVGNLYWMSLILGLLSARFRDTPPIVVSLLGIAFYVTPIMWTPDLLGDDQMAHLLLGLNPFYHLLQVVRLPLLGEFPTIENWVLASLSLVFGSAAAGIATKYSKNRIAYWI